MTIQKYERFVKTNINEALLDTPVIFIMGPRQGGKTTLAKEVIGKDWVFISLDDETQLVAAKKDPVGFIRELNARHIVIDEIQREPRLLLAIKQAVDEDRKPGRFLITGSANALLMPQVVDSLAGRIEVVRLNTLSECEIKSVKSSFLEKLMQGKKLEVTELRIRKYLIERIFTGCFPEPFARSGERRKVAWYKQYLNTMIHKDIKDLQYIDSPTDMLNLLKLIAHYSGKLINFQELSGKIGLSALTVKKYIALLEHLFFVEQLPAWHTNDYKRLVKTPKIHMVDTGLICSIRNISTEFLSSMPTQLGPLLETFVVNELRKQEVWLEEDLMFYHYRDKDKVEVDCIIENASGDCFAIEVKASATIGPEDFKGINRFKTVAKDRFKVGVLLYDGDNTIGFGENMYAVPIAALWA